MISRPSRSRSLHPPLLVARWPPRSSHPNSEDVQPYLTVSIPFHVTVSDTHTEANPPTARSEAINQLILKRDPQSMTVRILVKKSLTERHRKSIYNIILEIYKIKKFAWFFHFRDWIFSKFNANQYVKIKRCIYTIEFQNPTSKMKKSCEIFYFIYFQNNIINRFPISLRKWFFAMVFLVTQKYQYVMDCGSRFNPAEARRHQTLPCHEGLPSSLLLAFLTLPIPVSISSSRTSSL